VFTELSQNAIEQAYAQITSEARNEYTLDSAPKAVRHIATSRLRCNVSV